MTDEKQVTLEAVTMSLRNVVSIRDFVAAVSVARAVHSPPPPAGRHAHLLQWRRIGTRAIATADSAHHKEQTMKIILSFLSIAAVIYMAPQPAKTAEQWTEEETASGVKKVEYVRYALAGSKMTIQLLYAMQLEQIPVEFTHNLRA